MMETIWQSKQLRLKTKLRPYNSNILSVLLYSSECIKLTISLEHKLKVSRTDVSESVNDSKGILAQFYHQRRPASPDKLNSCSHKDQETKMEVAG